MGDPLSPPSYVWRKSTKSGTGNCVEVSNSGDSVLVRDSKNRLGGILEFTIHEWEAFLAGARLGEFDLKTLRR
jgi:hypothetical protein